MNTGRVPAPYYEEFHWLAREFPELKIILSHAGGLFPFFELNPKVRMEVTNISMTSPPAPCSTIPPSTKN